MFKARRSTRRTVLIRSILAGILCAPWSGAPAIEPGDANGDRQIDLGDVVYLLDYIYLGGPAPAAADCGGRAALNDPNGDGTIDLRDAISLVRHLFHGDPPPACGGLGEAVPSDRGLLSLDGPPAPSSPPDSTPYVRELVPEDLGLPGGGAFPPAVFMADVVINNTNANLTTTDTQNDGELSIAVNPADPNEIVITSFAEGWGANAPLWHSTDGGITWTKQFSISFPPGNLGGGGPNDQAVDFDANGVVYGTFLSCTTPPLCNVFSGASNNPANAASWAWALNGAGNALLTNAATTARGADQPWLLVNRDPTTANQVNTYVAYDDLVVIPSSMQVAVALGTNPPNFTRDNSPGTSGGGFVNPGHRLAVDPRTGFVYSLWQVRAGNGDDNDDNAATTNDNNHNINYMLNRSTDAGQNWTLNGAAGGIVVANADSTQACTPVPNVGCGNGCANNTFKFGTVNALLGGVDHAAVDPRTGDIYYVYGARDPNTNANRLAIKRIVGNGSGGVVVPANPTSFVTGHVQAAIPSVAVAADGRIAVFYYTFDGFSSDNFPIFTAHLALSVDQALTFTDTKLLTFLSSATDNGTCGQRVLGDYMQIKAVGRSFYGAFTANGAPFGRPVANHDPIFFRTSVGPLIQVKAPLTFGDVCLGQSRVINIEVFNTGTDPLVVSGVSRLNGSPDITVDPTPTFPVFIDPGSHVDFAVRCTPTTLGAHTATIRIASDDPDQPQFDVTATCNAPSPDIRISGSAEFGDVCAGDLAEKTLSICNVGGCDLHVSSVDFQAPCPDFTLINNPFPATVSPDFCLGVVIRFTPTSAGPKTCVLVIGSDDPDQAVIEVPVNASTPQPAIDVPPDLAFPPTVILPHGGDCRSLLPFPISNTGGCNLEITDIHISVGASEYELIALPSFPIILQPGHIVGEGDLALAFTPRTVSRSLAGEVEVTYVSDGITGATTTVTRKLCGEGVRTGARVLVTVGGVPIQQVEKLHLQRINANRNRDAADLDTVDVSMNLTVQSVTPAAPCEAFRFHREYGTVTNPVQMLPGFFQVSATAIVGGKMTTKIVGFNVDTCDFNPLITIEF